MNIEPFTTLADYIKYHTEERNRLQDLLSFSKQRDPVIIKQWREDLIKHNEALEREKLIEAGQ